VLDERVRRPSQDDHPPTATANWRGRSIERGTAASRPALHPRPTDESTIHIGLSRHRQHGPRRRCRREIGALAAVLNDADPELTSALLTEALQLQHIVDDLQDLAAAETGTPRLDPQPVRNADLVRRTATRLLERGACQDS
jgi:two-component system, OmpR family, sensor histidine kinase BaeS